LNEQLKKSFKRRSFSVPIIVIMVRQEVAFLQCS